MLIKSISYDQEEILQNILTLYSGGKIDADVTYSKGNFYKGSIPPPKYCLDIDPKDPSIIKSCCTCLPFNDAQLESLIFDPPFIVGAGKNSKIGNRFSSFPTMKDLWMFYTQSLKEFNRVLGKNGILIVKCMDTVSSNKQHLSHVHFITEAEKLKFQCEDIFILLAKSRMPSHKNLKSQKHARKYHSYFLVFKRKSND